MFRATHGMRRVSRDDLAGDQPVEQSAQRGQMLFDHRRRQGTGLVVLALQILDEGRHMKEGVMVLRPMPYFERHQA